MSMKLKKTIKRWFTLIEMLIVIVIIGIILWLTIYLWSNNILKLKNKTTKEDFIENLSSLYTNSLWSNYYNNQRFNELNIILNSWENRIYYDYVSDNLSQTWYKNISNEFTISQIFLSSWNISEEKDSWNIVISPYKFWCNIKDNTNTYYQSITIKTIIKTQDFCFIVNSNNCKLQEIDC